MRRSVHILFNNDSPELAFDNLSDAEAEASARQAMARAATRDNYPKAYWHTHNVDYATSEPRTLESDLKEDR